MRDKLTDAIRVGKASSIDPVKCTAQVTFEDRDGIVSGDLPIVVPFTLADKAYFMPEIGERVLVIFDPEAPSTGYILGSFFADTRRPPIGDENKRYFRFADGTHLEYDKRTHTLTIDIPRGSVNVKALSGAIRFTDGAYLEYNNEAHALTIDIPEGSISIKSAVGVNITAPVINLNEPE